MLKFKYAKESDIPAEHKALYENRNGTWFLTVEGVVDESTHSEFRNNNRALMRELNVTTMDEAIARLAELKDLDPVLYKTLKKEFDANKNKKLVDEGKIDELVVQRTEEMKKAHEKELKKRDDQIVSLTTSLEKHLIDDSIATAAASKGVRNTAVPDVKGRGRQLFKLQDGKVVAIDENGKEKFGKDGKTLSVTEWMDSLATDAPHLFEPNGGGGSGTHHRQNSGYSGKNPWSNKSINRTEQVRIKRENPTLAAQLEAEANREG